MEDFVEVDGIEPADDARVSRFFLRSSCTEPGLLKFFGSGPFRGTNRYSTPDAALIT